MKNDVIICSATGSFALALIGILTLHYCGPQPLWLAMAGGGQQFNPAYLILLLTVAIVGAFIGSVLGVKVGSTNSAFKDGATGSIVGSLIGLVLLYQTIGFLNYFSPLLICISGLSASSLVLWAGLIKHKI